MNFSLFSDNDKNSDNNEFENAKFRMRRCTPAINTNGGLQPSDFTFSNQNKALVCIHIIPLSYVFMGQSWP